MLSRRMWHGRWPILSMAPVRHVQHRAHRWRQAIFFILAECRPAPSNERYKNFYNNNDQINRSVDLFFLFYPAAWCAAWLVSARKRVFLPAEGRYFRRCDDSGADRARITPAAATPPVGQACRATAATAPTSCPSGTKMHFFTQSIII